MEEIEEILGRLDGIRETYKNDRLGDHKLYLTELFMLEVIELFKRIIEKIK